MKDLLLLRHAKSSWAESGQDDFDRPLSGRGRRAARLVSEHLAAKGLRPTAILCSAALRTRQTLDLLAGALDVRANVAVERRLYLADAAAMLARLRAVADEETCVLLIAHNPGIQDLALALTAHAPAAARRRIQAKYPTAALTHLRVNLRRWRDLSPDAVRSVAFVTPADIED